MSNHRVFLAAASCYRFESIAAGQTRALPFILSCRRSLPCPQPQGRCPRGLCSVCCPRRWRDRSLPLLGRRGPGALDNRSLWSVWSLN